MIDGLNGGSSAEFTGIIIAARRLRRVGWDTDADGAWARVREALELPANDD